MWRHCREFRSCVLSFSPCCYWEVGVCGARDVREQIHAAVTNSRHALSKAHIFIMKRKGDLLIHESKRRALTAILQYAQVHALPAVSGPRELRNVRDAASVGITTPYGPLIQDHRFEHTDGESFTMVEMINPFAMLYYIASTSQFFCACLEYMLQLHGPCTPEIP